MTADELGEAVVNVERVLLSLKESADQAAAAIWDTCLSRLKARRSALAPAPAPELAKDPSPSVGDRSPDPACREGEFTTENGYSSYDVYFTNSSGRKCTMVKAYCLCSLSYGAYKQSKDISVNGSFSPGEKTRLASVSLSGPTGGGVDWSWCKFRH
jgi:hypothetical protein